MSKVQLEGRRIIVTGAGSGIGKAIALQAAEAGAQVALVGRTAAKLEAVAGRAAGCHAVVADVTSEDQVQRAVERSQEEMGGLDGLINCAGFTSMSKLEETSLADWQAQLGIHMTATFLMCRAAVPFLRGDKDASIVNIASVAGLAPGISGAAYSAAKGGQIVFSKALAAELAPAIRVNALCVGPTATPLSNPNYERMKRDGSYEDFLKLFPLRKIADPEEIAHIALFLLSSASTYVTGAAWAADGGRSLH